jgi:hypothetical protein
VVVSIVVAVGGWFGLSKYQDVSKMFENIKQNEEHAQQAENSARDSAEKARKLEKNLEFIPQITKNLEQAILLTFVKELTEKTPTKGKIVAFYQILLPLRSNDPTLKWRILGEIEKGMFNTQNTNLWIYADLLSMNIEDPEAQAPREKIIAYYLFLSCLILDIENQKERFNESFSKFLKYVGEHKNQHLKNELDFSMLEDLFEGQDQKKRELFRQVKGYIP